MKTKNLLSPVVLMLIALAVTAQNATNKQHSVKDIIPFGKKLPVPDLSKYPGRPLPGITRPGTNTALMQGINSLNANMIKKDPDYYRQQLLKSRATSVESFQRNSTLAAEEGNRSCPTSDFHLTKDINALKESNPHNYIDFHVNTSFAILDDVIYFAAEDGAHGMELWRSDGTAAGTYMVKDIEPGEGSSLSYAANITVVKGKIYFSAFTTAYGWEPWTSDGTENSTHLLMDIKPGELWSWAGQFFGIGSTVYFVTDGDFSSWGALWKTDGTKAGTKLVKNIGDEGSGGFLISQLTAVNGLLFFTFLNFNSNSWELWRSDGTDAGTYHIGTSIFFLDIPAQLTNYNSKLYFSSNDGSGRKLWVSDGTDAGTTPAPSNHDILIDADYLGITFPVLNNALYIPGLTTSKGWGLYKYDASDAAGLIKIKDLAPGLDPAFIVPSEMVVIKNTLYFKVTNYNGSLHDELWSSKGTNVTTQILKTFLSGETIYSLYNGNGILYSVKHEAVYGSELFKTNGSGDDITLVSDIFKGVTSSYPAYLTAFKGKLLFSAADELKGNELFMTDGTDKSTALVKDINTVSTSSSYPGSLTALGHDVLFTAYERVHGDELYKSDGTSQGTDLLHDIGPGELGSYPGLLSTKNNAVYFIALSGSTSYSIYKTNGTKPGLKQITPYYDYTQYFVQSFSVTENGLVFYTVFNYNTFTYELWRSNGTAAGTFMLSSTLHPYNYLNVVGNTAFFVAGDAVNGYELWKSDGSLAGTGMVKDINPGLNDAVPGGMFAYKNEVYFGAYDGTSANYSFWKSDGTEAGTIKLKNIDPWWGFNASSTEEFFCISNNILYFSGVNYSNGKGTVLWKTDGTPEGTKQVKDIDPNGDVIYIPIALTDVNGTLFFITDDGVHGIELWKSDGTWKGTHLVKDITKGSDGSFSPDAFPMLVSYSGKLFFVTANASLWSSDGTANGTNKVDDRGLSGVQISNIIPAGNKLFLSGYTYKYGQELYVGKVDDEGKFAAVTTADEATAQTSTVFNTLLYPNPASSKATLQITGNAKNVYISITDMSGKKLWQSSNNNAMLVNLPTENWLPESTW